MVKKNVLSDCTNLDSMQSESLRWSGSKFQRVGPATENARRPSVLRRWRCVVSKQRRMRNVVADDWRCLILERSSLPGTAALCYGDIGGL